MVPALSPHVQNTDRYEASWLRHSELGVPLIRGSRLTLAGEPIF
jgi:hypothetical protein